MNNKTQSAITPSSTQRHCHRIILIGYMGAGKTTVGKALAAELGLRFYDLDWYIESRMRKTVAQLFAELGEEGFRRIERNMLHEVAEFEGVLISCGGGTPCFYDNMQYINQQGLTLYLKASQNGKIGAPTVAQQNTRRGATLYQRTTKGSRTILYARTIHARRELDG